MAIISHINVNNEEHPIASNNMLYGVCSTAAATAAKTVTISDSKFTLQTGSIVAVKFTYGNSTNNSPTLNVDGTGAKAIYMNGNRQWCLRENRIYTFIYDGTNWNIINTFPAAGTGTNAEIFNDYVNNVASGGYSHAEGFLTQTTGFASHAEGAQTKALADYSHAEGSNTEASGNTSHAEGFQTIASSSSDHAEGNKTQASGGSSHAEGFQSVSSGSYSHAEGEETIASGQGSHAEGATTVASGIYSHAEGIGVIAKGMGQHAQGKNNIEDTSNKYAHIVGNGTVTSPSNAHTLDWDGNAWFAGDVYVGSTSGTDKDSGSVKLATMNDIPTAADLGLSNALHFIGTVTSLPASATNGDVVLMGSKEYVYSNGWIELGDGDSHALKTITISAGSGLTGGGNLSANRTISHADTSNVTNITANGRTYVTGLTFDGFGHVTGVTTGTETVVNTDTGATAVEITGSGNAVTSASYNASTRKLTLSKEAIYATDSQLGDTYNKVISRGEQLIVNGSGLMGNDTNFSAWTFDGAIANNSSGSFTYTSGAKATLITDEYFPVNPAQKYKISIDAKTKSGLSRAYSFLSFYDADKLEINAKHHIYNSASTTTLAKDLKAGDTVAYLTDVSGWSTTYSYGMYLTIWNYTNSNGYTYPAGTYSRNRLSLPSTSNKLSPSAIDTTAKTITLASAYTGTTIPAGTYVSQGGDGGTYKYTPLVNTLIPTTWTTYTGYMEDIDTSGGNVSGKFPPGVAYCKLGFLWNYNTAADQTWITNISVTNIDNIPTKLPNPNALTFTGAVTGSYDGSSAKTVNIPENTDTGATSVEVTGTGNAITSASYDASTRKLTLTKGATYSNNSGDITGVTAGNGLTGGGTSGDVALAVGAGDGITVAADIVSVSYGTSTAALGTSSAGSAKTVSRSDHVHALPALTSCTGTLTVAKGGTGQTSIVDSTYTTARYRASSLHASPTTPTSNGVICWTYE